VLERNYARDEFCVGVYDPDNQAVMWSYSGTPTSGDNDKVLVYWVENSKRIGEPSWTPWRLSEYVNCWTVITDPGTKRRYVGIGLADGNLGAWGSSGDAEGTELVEFYWYTGFYDAGLPEYIKKWGEVMVEAVEQSYASELLIAYYREITDLSGYVMPTHNTVFPIFRRRIGRFSRHLSLGFYANTSDPAEVMSWTLEVGRAGLA